jgi:hypothetical protein
MAVVWPLISWSLPSDGSTCHNIYKVKLLPVIFTVYTERIFTLLTGSMTMHFTATGAPLAVRHIRILPMNQHA